MDEVELIDWAMGRAIMEARKGAGYVSPNPQVGCVILSNNELLSVGFHKKFGGPHAEVNALDTLRKVDPAFERLKGARLIVTLEPCAHEGKTPSCAKAIAKLPIKEVIFGVTDPNPLVSGLGAEIIRKAGIACREYQGALKSDLEEVAEHFLVNQRERRPFISLKVATSLDGQLAMKSGDSKWISNELSRREAHSLRAQHEAILIGQGTLVQDDPELNVRHSCYPEKTNKVIVLLSAKTPLPKKQWKLLGAHKPEDLYFLRPLPGGGYGRVNPIDSLDRPTHEKFTDNFAGIANSILIEGGARVLSHFLSQRRCDRLYVFQAPTILGAKGGKSWTEQVKIESMDDKIGFLTPRIRELGGDVMWTARLSR